MIIQETNREKVNMKWPVAIVIAALIVLGLYQNIFSLVAFALVVAVAVFFSTTDALFILVFLIPFANIFKMAPKTQSFFTYALILYTLVFALRAEKINQKFLWTFLLLTGYLMVQMVFSENLLRIIKFLVNILFVYYAYHLVEEEKYPEIFKGYIGGVCVSSALVVLDVIPNFSLYVKTKELMVDAAYTGRFAGLYSDPNYYSINVIIAMCLLIVLLHTKKIKTPLFAGLMVCLVYFAVLTYSKSAFLMLAVPLIFFLYANAKRRKFIVLFVCLCAAAVLLVNILAGKISILSAVLDRINNADDLDSLTTGRLGIWEYYMRHFSNMDITLFFGSGFNGALLEGKAAHNTYIDMLHYLGVFGTIFLMTTLIAIWKSVCRHTQRNLLNYSVLLVVLVMYFFLSQLFYFDIAFHILMVIMVMNMDLQTDRKNVKGEGVNNENLTDQRAVLPQ